MSHTKNVNKNYCWIFIEEYNWYEIEYQNGTFNNKYKTKFNKIKKLNTLSSFYYSDTCIEFFILILGINCCGSHPSAFDYVINTE